MTRQGFDTRYSPASKSERGFTMIEMVIAIVVVTVGLVSIVGISVYVSRTNSTSNTLNVLATAGQDQVDRLRTAVWSRTYTDPRLAVDPVTKVGGSLTGEYQTPDYVPSPMSAMSASAETQPYSAYGSTTTGQYTYIQDPEDPYHAVAADTPAGDLDIRWEVRQGPSPDMRYVTIKVVQMGALPHLKDGFQVTTILNKN